jgi:hypothetical protein
VLLAAAPLAHAQTSQGVFALRVLPSSTFTDNPCNAPCQCIIDPVPQPIAGRIYLAPAVSIPEVSAMAGPYRLSFLAGQAPALGGWASYTTNFDPAILSRLTMSMSYAGVSWTLDSGYFTPGNPPFPTLIVNLASAQSDCTTVHLELQTEEVCVADFDDGSGRGFPDRAVTVDDLLFYLGAFSQGDLIADIDSSDANGIPDQAATIDDLLSFLRHFEAGC